jgi:hypothetical protein
MESAVLLFFLGAIVARRKSNVVFLRVVELRSLLVDRRNWGSRAKIVWANLGALALSALLHANAKHSIFIICAVGVCASGTLSA